MNFKYFPVIFLASIFVLFIFSVPKFLNISAQDYNSSSSSSTSTYPYATSSCSYTYSDWSSCSTAGMQSRMVISKSPAGCIEVFAPVLEQSCSYIAPYATSSYTTSSSSYATSSCYYIYGEWGPCSSLGMQTRTYTKSPLDCFYDVYHPPLTEQKCTNYATSTYATSSPATCYYAFSDWSPCDAYGRQTRKIIYKSPSGCVEGITPTLEQTCYKAPYATSSYATSSGSTYATSSDSTICSYIYGDWSPCSSSGIQTRTYKIPTGCLYGINYSPITEQTCTGYTTPTYHATSTPVACSYTYGDWSLCDVFGRQTRKIASKYPAGCLEDKPPVSERSCDQANATTSKSILPVCDYYYSAWGDCVSNNQTRIIISKPASDCYEAVAPVLTQSCKSTSSVSDINRPEDAPKPAPESVAVPEITGKADFNERTSGEWQDYYFKSKECFDRDTCGGNADPDNDGLDNNEEYRFGTDPKDPDSDHDGRVDAGEIQDGRNPLAAPTEWESDKMTFENPKDSGETKKEIYQVVNVEMVPMEEATTALKISGKALPDTYITVYIYSDPIVMTVKTDSEGNWSLVLDKPLEEGRHEVYVAVTDAEGKITAKSEPLAFVQTAQAATIIPAAVSKDKAASPTKARLAESYFIFTIAGIFGLLLALAALGMIKGRQNKQNEE